MTSAAEHSFSIQNGALGWPAPKPDGWLGGPGASPTSTSRTWATSGSSATRRRTRLRRSAAARKCFSCLVLDNDYSPSEFGYPDPNIPLRVTMAHEYNHVLQFGIDSIQDGWLFESTAVWAEEKTFPDDNDYLNYLPEFASTPSIPITDFGGGGGLRVYGLATFLHWLDGGDGGFGPAVVLASWLNSTKTQPKDYAVGAVDRAIRDRRGKGFAAEFVRFAAATAEWQRAGGFPDAEVYPDVKSARASCGGGRAPQRIAVDHTAYRLLTWRRPRDRLKLQRARRSWRRERHRARRP